MKSLACLCCCLIALLLASSVCAQDAELSGSVRDTRGAVIPKAAVRVLNKSTGASRATETNGSGIYDLPSLPPGTYDVDVAAQGFKKFVRNDLELHVAQKAALDFTLEVGSVQETVTVAAGSEILNRTDASVGMVVDRQFVDNLPLNGRSFQQLITQVPGVTLAPSSATAGQFSINGQRPTANYLSIDGAGANLEVFASANTPGNTFPGNAAGGTDALVSVDALQEFRVLTSSYAPEYGHSAGGQIIIRTRSGTNQFHGSAFEYLRNNVLDANDWFANTSGKPHPPFRFNDFGGVLGGPIVRDKTFFFFSYEGQRIRQPQFKITVVPSLAARQSASPATQPLLNAYPIPNGANLANGQAQLAAGYSNPLTTDATSIRLDHVFSPRVSAFARYNYAPSSSTIRGVSVNPIAALSVLNNAPRQTQTLTGGMTYILNPRLVNELSLNLSDNSLLARFTMDDFMGAKPPTAQALLPPGVSPDHAFAQVTNSFAGSILEAGTGSFTEQRQINLVDALDFTFGSHQLKFGVDYRRLLPFAGPANFVVYNFGSVSTLAANTPTAFSRGQYTPARVRMENLSLYAQDTWHVSARLTATYGLRWELNPPAHNLGPNNGNYIPVLGNYADASTIYLGAVGSSLWDTKYSDFAPRLGLSYLLRQRSGWDTVIRGGGGLFYDLGVGTSSISPWLQFPNFVTTGRLSGVAFPATALQAALPPLDLSNPPVGQQFYTYPRDYESPRTWQWNIAVQQALGQAQAVTVSYVAALGRKLLYNQYFYNAGAKLYNINYTDNESSSDYQSLQVLFQRRFTAGLAASASYTWAHALDNVSSDQPGGVPNQPGPFLDPNINRGPADYDVRHEFNAAFSYDLPGGKHAPWINALTRGWGADAIITARSAMPVDVRTIQNIGFGTFYFRPDLAPGVPLYLYGSQYPGGKAFNPAAFVTVTTRQGNLGRNALRGFDLAQADLSARRSFQLSERLRLLFRADLFNILNHPNFADPVNTLGTGTFGKSTSMLNSQISGGAVGGSALNSVFQVGGPRSVQLSLKLQF